MSESYLDVALRALRDISAEVLADPEPVESGGAQRMFNALMASMELGATHEQIEEALYGGLVEGAGL